jgi:hypothetical protein
MSNAVTVVKVLSRAERAEALAVVEAVYRHEKRWLSDVESEIPADPSARRDQSWFLVRVDGAPAGAIRLAYDPALSLPAELEVTLEPGVDLEALRRRGRFVDIGRFMILPRHRRNLRVAMRLMRAASLEVIERGYTHFLTDVFADDPHSPLGFHTRVLGFERIATHARGELACASPRVLLVLDIARGYERLKATESRVYRELAQGMGELLAARETAAAA